MAAHGIAFFEEPQLANEPSATWAELARRTGAALNPNPLRTELASLDLGVCGGTLPPSTGPGLGVEPDPQPIRPLAPHPAAILALGR